MKKTEKKTMFFINEEKVKARAIWQLAERGYLQFTEKQA